MLNRIIPKTNNMYSVFYNEINSGFFQLKTDYPTIEEAEMFIQSNHFKLNQLNFLFMLKDGKELIKGKPLENSQEHFNQAMKFAIDIPKEEYMI